ncbi:metallophosphoesterase family protein [Companilactobacillus furfuricola]|uniref:metallophosphoesterase family protein n=1 Tax=Companilactobacillus furfuricola TaxID=1462575 RepID=UPI0013DE1375|nr:metallophosphoesterase [Companilactobacillus furfuricola]
MNKFKIIQITDTHLTPEGHQAANHQKIDPFLKLNSIFMDVSKMSEKPDMIVITGDLIHEGVTKDYSKLARLISQQMDKLQISINVILGNHDRTTAFYQGYLEQPEQAKYYYLVSGKDLNFYFLDSKFYDYEQGYLGQEQLTWLRDNLEDEPLKKSIIFLHHPVAGPSIQHMQYSVLQEGQELMEVIKDSPVMAVFSGHIHFSTTFTKNNILFHTTDSSAYHINCDDHHKHLIYDATNYDIITIEDDNIGVETRCLLAGQDVINHVDVADTGFVDPGIFQ